jgi:hypothetical protein
MYLPDKASKAPDDRDQCKRLSHVCGVRRFTYHSLHDSNVAIQETAHTAAGETVSA